MYIKVHLESKFLTAKYFFRIKRTNGVRYIMCPLKSAVFTQVCSGVMKMVVVVTVNTVTFQWCIFREQVCLREICGLCRPVRCCQLCDSKQSRWCCLWSALCVEPLQAPGLQRAFCVTTWLIFPPGVLLVISLDLFRHTYTHWELPPKLHPGESSQHTHTLYTGSKPCVLIETKSCFL